MNYIVTLAIPVESENEEEAKAKFWDLVDNTNVKWIITVKKEGVNGATGETTERPISS